jgi:hypothetical protein
MKTEFKLSPPFAWLGRILAFVCCMQAVAAESLPSEVLIGTVTSSKGPEAGVWVIAETNDLPTKYVKIVVTDDGGRYVMPEMPAANYDVWVRGYGLVDSEKF